MAVTYLADMMEGKFTVSFTDGFNYLHVHYNIAGVTQLAESQFSKLLVASSSLVSRSKEHSHEIIG